MSTMPDNSEAADRIRRAAQQVAGRIRWNRALERLATGTFCSSLVIALVLTLRKLGWLSGATFWWVTGIAAAATAVWVAAAHWSDVDLIGAAHRLDRHHGLQDRLSTALSLVVAHERDVDRGFVSAQLMDAASAAAQVEPKAAEPLRWPMDAAVAGVGVGVVALLGFVQPPDHTHPLPDPPDIKHSVVLDDTSIALARDRLERLREDPDIEADSRASEVIDELAELLDRAGNRDISADAFNERLEQLEAKLEETAGDDVEARAAADLQKLADELRQQAGADLEEFPELEQAAKALENQQFDKAAEELEKLSESLSKSAKDGGLSDEKRRKLSKLLERMGGSMSDEQLRELYENNKSLANQFDPPDSNRRLEGGDRRGDGESRNNQPSAGQEENRLNDGDGQNNGRGGADDAEGASSDPQRQLKRLRRRAERAAQQRSRSGDSSRQSSGQQRDASQGSEGRGRQARGGRERESGERRQGRRSNEGGRQQAREDGRTERRQAQGQRDQGRDREGDARQQRQSQRDSERGRSGRQRVEREIDRMRESMRRSRSGDRSRRQRASNDQGGSRSDRVRKFIRRAEGRQQQRGQSGEKSGQQGGRQGQQSGSGSSSSGGGQGSSRGQQDRLDDSSESLNDVERTPTQARSRRGAGPTRREVIRSTSDKGFATTEYRDIYAEYEDVAEEVMEREDVPRGYRFYIQRYFELIRPRSASPPDTTPDE